MNQKERDLLQRNIKVENRITLKMSRVYLPQVENSDEKDWKIKTIYKDFIEAIPKNNKLSSLHDLEMVKDIFKKNILSNINISANDLLHDNKVILLLDRNKDLFKNSKYDSLNFYYNFDKNGIDIFLVIDLARNIIVKNIILEAELYDHSTNLTNQKYINMIFTTIIRLNKRPYENYHMMEFIKMITSLIYHEYNQKVHIDMEYYSKKYNDRIKPIADIKISYPFDAKHSISKLPLPEHIIVAR